MNVKEIRKQIKSLTKTQFHPNVWLPTDDLYDSILLSELYTNVRPQNSLNELIASLIDVRPDELLTLVLREVTKYIKILSDSETTQILDKFKNTSAQKIRTKDGLAKYIKSSLTDYTDLILEYVQRVLNLDIVIIDAPTRATGTKITNYTNVGCVQDSILIVYRSQETFSAMAFKDTLTHSMTIIHSRKSLPRELDHFMDPHNYFLGLIKTTLEMSPKTITLHELYSKIVIMLGVTRLTKSHRHLINKISTVLLDNMDYHSRMGIRK